MTTELRFFEDYRETAVRIYRDWKGNIPRKNEFIEFFPETDTDEENDICANHFKVVKVDHGFGTQYHFVDVLIEPLDEDEMERWF